MPRACNTLSQRRIASRKSSFSSVVAIMPLLYVQEFLRVGHETNSLNAPGLDLDLQHQKRLAICAEDDGRLAIDFCDLHMRMLRQKAAGTDAKARHRIAPADRTQ